MFQLLWGLTLQSLNNSNFIYLYIYIWVNETSVTNYITNIECVCVFICLLNSNRFRRVIFANLFISGLLEFLLEILPIKYISFFWKKGFSSITYKTDLKLSLAICAISVWDFVSIFCKSKCAQHWNWTITFFQFWQNCDFSIEIIWNEWNINHRSV